MEANSSIDDPCEAILLSSITKDDKSSGVEHCVELDDLLEECWFFGNLLVNPKPVITTNTFTRCFSDPCPSSSTTPPLPLPILEDTTSSAGDSYRSLVRAPSLPMNIGREEEGLIVLHNNERPRENKVKDKPKVDKVQACVDKGSEGNICQRKNRKSNGVKVLTRTQTLPPCMKNVEINMDQEGETDQSHRKMNKSGRRVSLNLVDFLPPRHDKNTSRYYREVEGIKTNTDGSKDMRRRFLNGRTLRRSTSELEIEEVQGFKDLGFTFDNKDSLSPSVVNILPGLQQKNGEDLDLENKVKRPYLSEAWLIQCSPAPPNWASTRSSEDMKAQIKFWARSVATNVHLEC